MSSLHKIEEECDLEILELLELELQECRKLKEIKQRIDKTEILEKKLCKRHP